LEKRKENYTKEFQKKKKFPAGFQGLIPSVILNPGQKYVIFFFDQESQFGRDAGV